MNPHLQAVGYEYKVAPETEQTFDDDFFESLDMVGACSLTPGTITMTYDCDCDSVSVTMMMNYD